ncbi:MAG TPA: hypothetical protein VNW46_17145 [Gemmatimonadaceae bacterium]|nr:hypothetical protein [Gemmatimonadaceae bacterium]
MTRRREAVDATSREIARLESDLVIAEHAVTVARGAARAQAEAKLGQIRAELTQYRDELQAHTAAIARDTDDRIAVIKAQAAVEAAPARQRLETVADQLRVKRDALAAQATTLRQAAAAEWQGAKSNFDRALHELVSVEEPNAATGGRRGK